MTKAACIVEILEGTGNYVKASQHFSTCLDESAVNVSRTETTSVL